MTEEVELGANNVRSLGSDIIRLLQASFEVQRTQYAGRRISFKAPATLRRFAASRALDKQTLVHFG
jgi:hypothetical protein